MADTTEPVNLHEIDPEARLLFDRPPPRKRSYCVGCGVLSERYEGRYCWLCVHAGVPVGSGRAPIATLEAGTRRKTGRRSTKSAGGSQ